MMVGMYYEHIKSVEIHVSIYTVIMLTVFLARLCQNGNFQPISFWCVGASSMLYLQFFFYFTTCYTQNVDCGIPNVLRDTTVCVG